MVVKIIESSVEVEVEKNKDIYEWQLDGQHVLAHPIRARIQVAASIRSPKLPDFYNMHLK